MDKKDISELVAQGVKTYFDEKEQREAAAKKQAAVARARQRNRIDIITYISIAALTLYAIKVFDLL